jgi:hypothetical protein
METMLSQIEEIAFKEQCLIIDQKMIRWLSNYLKILNIRLIEEISSCTYSHKNFKHLILQFFQ